jgi:D-sedoheptulose 7-phosphate isomerase
MSSPGFITRYLGGFHQALAEVTADDIGAVVATLAAAHERNARVFIAGNGGSAALASHLACDLEKTAAGAQPRLVRRRLRAVSLSDNVATLTAWANDEGFAVVFSEQLRAHADPGDVLVVISASGNSPNILAALEAAADLGMVTIALLGFEGGRALAMVDQALHVPVTDYGIVEGVHGVLAHVISASLMLALAEQRHGLPSDVGPLLAEPREA